MISVGQEIIDFEIIGVKPKFNQYEENGLKRIPPSAKFAEQNKIK